MEVPRSEDVILANSFAQDKESFVFGIEIIGIISTASAATILKFFRRFREQRISSPAVGSPTSRMEKWYPNPRIVTIAEIPDRQASRFSDGCSFS